jgi:hypothetical protein
MAIERFVEMFEAALGCDSVAGQERKLSGPMHEPFQGIEAVVGGDLPDRIHPGVNVERRESFGSAGDLGEPLADLVPHWCEPVGDHRPSPR